MNMDENKVEKNSNLSFSFNVPISSSIEEFESLIKIDKKQNDEDEDEEEGEEEEEEYISFKMILRSILKENYEDFMESGRKVNIKEIGYQLIDKEEEKNVDDGGEKMINHEKFKMVKWEDVNEMVLKKSDIENNVIVLTIVPNEKNGDKEGIEEEREGKEEEGGKEMGKEIEDKKKEEEGGKEMGKEIEDKKKEGERVVIYEKENDEWENDEDNDEEENELDENIDWLFEEDDDDEKIKEDKVSLEYLNQFLPAVDEMISEVEKINEEKKSDLVEKKTFEEVSTLTEENLDESLEEVEDSKDSIESTTKDNVKLSNDSQTKEIEEVSTLTEGNPDEEVENSKEPIESDTKGIVKLTYDSQTKEIFEEVSTLTEENSDESLEEVEDSIESDNVKLTTTDSQTKEQKTILDVGEESEKGETNEEEMINKEVELQKSHVEEGKEIVREDECKITEEKNNVPEEIVKEDIKFKIEFSREEEDEKFDVIVEQGDGKEGEEIACKKEEENIEFVESLEIDSECENGGKEDYVLDDNRLIEENAGETKLKDIQSGCSLFKQSIGNSQLRDRFKMIDQKQKIDEIFEHILYIKKENSNLRKKNLDFS